MTQTKLQKKRLLEAKGSGKFKKAKFNDIVRGCKSSGKSEESCKNIAGSIKAKQIKRFGSQKVGGRLEVAR